MGSLNSLLLLVILNTAGFTTPQSNLLASKSFCGYQHTDDYVRDNNNISIDEFPWMAQLLYNKERKIQCTGSLINNRYVLTAAHCINTPYSKLVAVRLGDFNVTTEKDCMTHSRFSEECSDPVQEFDIEEIILHPGHDFPSSYNDIGLIRLSRNVEYSEYIRPICMPLNNLELIDGQQLATSGWGRIGVGITLTDIKKKVLTTLISLENCQRHYAKYGIGVTDKNICTTEAESRTCEGDSGAPLMMSVKSQWIQVGVLSFGNCRSRFPSGYMKVTSYLNWILENLRK